MSSFDNNSTQILFVEGNIGSGKSTLVKEAYDNYKDNDDVYFLQEPVEQWKEIVDENGIDIITNYYKDQKKYGFKFQMMAYITRLKDLRNIIKEKKYKLIICERSLYTDKNVFAQMLYDDKIIDEIGFTIYSEWFECFMNDFPESKYVYLKTDPEVCEERIKKRARKGEECIPLDYLKSLHNYHEKWLNEEGDKVLDGNKSIQENCDNLFTYIDNIL